MTNLAIDARFGAGAVKVDIGRGSLITILVSGSLWVLMEFGFIWVALTDESRGTRIIGSVFALLFGVPLILLIALLPKLLRPRGLAFNARGVHYWEGQSSNFVAWDGIAAIGIGYEQPPGLPVISLSDYIGEKLMDGLKIDRRRALGVEIFPVDARAVEQQPLLLRYRRDQPPPSPALSSVRWRIPLPPVPGLAVRVSQGVETYQPTRWLGFFARPWRGGIGV